MTATAAPLAPDLVAGLRRLKLARIRAIAAEICQTAKTQRWAPDEFLRTLIDEEISARDESNLRGRIRQAGFHRRLHGRPHPPPRRGRGHLGRVLPDERGQGHPMARISDR